jgi:AcrR family transcriptional regulator
MPNARKAATTREKIRREALNLFVERGVPGVSVRDIAAAVGMTAANLYAHYRGMNELVGDLFHRGHADYARCLVAAAAVDGDFRTRLESMVRRICQLHGEDEVLFRFVLLTKHEPLSEAEAEAEDNATNPIAVIEQMIERAIAAGEIGPGDPALLAAAIVGVVVQAATFRLRGRITRGLDDMADEIVALCLRLVPQ